MEIQQVRSFLAVVKGGGFAKAAGVVHRTQPAVTSSVKTLEKQLGLKLFERRGRTVALTPAGEALLAESGPVLDRWDGMQDRVLERLAGEAQGQIRIGAGEAAVLYLLPGILTRFQKLFPKVRIIIHHQRADETLRMLKAGELDLGVRSLVAVPSWAYFRPSLKYRRMAVSAKNHPFAQERAVTIESIARHPLLFPGTQSITRVIVEEKLTKRGLTYKVGLEAGGWEAIKTYAANGFGVAVVPELCLSPIDRRRLLVADASGLFGEDRYGVVVRSGTFAPKAVAKMITLLDPEFPENVLEKPKK